MRALLAARWIETQGTAPPVPFAELVATADVPLRDALNELIAAKAVSTENESQGKIRILDEFIAEALESKEPSAASPDPDAETILRLLNKEFRSIVSPKAPRPMRKAEFTLDRVRDRNFLLFDAGSGSHVYGTQTPKSDIDRRGNSPTRKSSISPRRGWRKYRPRSRNPLSRMSLIAIRFSIYFARFRSGFPAINWVLSDWALRID